MDEISGFYNDDGTKINPDLYPKPQLCLSCKKNDDPNEYIVCTLTQLGARNGEEFKCFAYENRND